MTYIYDFVERQRLDEFIRDYRLTEELDDLYSLYEMKNMMISAIEDDEFYTANHLVETVNSEPIADYYSYDFSMGTFENPEPVYNLNKLFEFFEDKLINLGISKPCQQYELD